MTGTIKKVFDEKGYGFITAENGKEHFFHSSGCVEPFHKLKAGKKVSFEEVASPKGARAESVRLI